MKFAVIFEGKVCSVLLFSISLIVWPPPAVSQPIPDRMLNRMDTDGGGKISRSESRGRRRPSGFFDTDGDGFIPRQEIEVVSGDGGRQRGRRRGQQEFRRGNEGVRLDGEATIDVLDEETLCGIGRGRRCDVKLYFKRGLIETGLQPAFPKGLDCPEIDEAWAIDYSSKRDREAYHGGIDMPTPFGTPIIAAAAGTVVAKYEGRNSFRGREIILRHSPGDTGLPVWIYTQYTHFETMPKQKIGQRVKMGEVLGPTGNSGKQRLSSRRPRRSAIHYAVWFSTDPRYVPLRRKVIPVDSYWMDPIALYRKGPPFDSNSMKALPEGEKQVAIAVMTEKGEVIPAGAKVVWPYFCRRGFSLFR